MAPNNPNTSKRCFGDWQLGTRVDLGSGERAKTSSSAHAREAHNTTGEEANKKLTNWMTVRSTAMLHVTHAGEQSLATVPFAMRSARGKTRPDPNRAGERTAQTYHSVTHSQSDGEQCKGNAPLSTRTLSASTLTRHTWQCVAV